jgi:hypothetical protein
MWEEHYGDGKTNQQGLLTAAQYKWMEETSRGQEYLEASCGKSQGLIRSVALIKKKKISLLSR